MYKEPGVLIIPYPMGTEVIIPVGPARICSYLEARI